MGACWLIISCMRFENIRAVVARKTIKSLKESTWNTIKTVLKNWGLKEEVNYRINNLEGTLTFWNDSVIIMKEMVDLPCDMLKVLGLQAYTQPLRRPTRLQTGYVPGSYRMKTETRWNAGRERLIYRSPYSTTRTSLSGRLTRRH